MQEVEAAPAHPARAAFAHPCAAQDDRMGAGSAHPRMEGVRLQERRMDEVKLRLEQQSRAMQGNRRTVAEMVSPSAPARRQMI